MSEKAIFRMVMAVSVVVFVAVVILNKKILPVPAVIPHFVYHLPKFHAFLNGTCSLILISSFLAIKNKRVTLHRRLNIAAFFISSLFLVSYITYHWLAPETSFPTNNPFRPFYLFILITHIVLAGVVLPLILLSFYQGLKNNIVKHRKLVRWTFPIWLYVTITGVVVYLMICPWYNFPA
ncbi:MAG TPA: DUF420 domain-containing protein [Bacteroidia bacterium]|nr:DUF420 domain-containing protein [Bacteroidia bacterium]